MTPPLNKITARIWQISQPQCENSNEKLFEMMDKLREKSGYDLPEFGILEGTTRPYIIAIPIECNPCFIFDEYNVKYIGDQYFSKKDFDLDKFNSNYQLGISYFPEDDCYVLRKPYFDAEKLNGIKINDDGFPINKNNNVIEGSLKFPTHNCDPKFNIAMNHNLKYSEKN